MRGPAPPSFRVLQRGQRHTVALERDTGVVRKTFHGGERADDRAAAVREHDRISKFHEALSGHPVVACPRPVGLSLDAQPYVRMEHALGVPLVKHLARVSMDERARRLYATALAEALAVYVNTFQEPYWDLHFRNMLVDPGRQRLALLDFDVPEPVKIRQNMLGRMNPLGVSLGNLVGSTVFNACRPNQLRRQRLHRQSLSLASETVDACLSAPLPGSADPPTLQAVAVTARTCFWLSADSGPEARRLWYRTVGRAIATHTSAQLPRTLRPFAAKPYAEGET